MLTSRQISILKVIIDDFIHDATPVGSKNLQTNHDLPYSSATIRNEMAVLEELGLLEKTHTSSGRVPSNQGYRYYVDYLIDNQDIDVEVKMKLENLFNNRRLELDEIVKETCNIIASMTNYTSIALGSDAKSEILSKIDVLGVSSNSIVIVIVTKSGKVESKIFNIDSSIDINELQKCVKILNQMLVGQRIDSIRDLIENDVRKQLSLHVTNYEVILDAFVNAFIKFASDHVYVGGRNNIINQPDFNDINKIRLLINTLEDQDFFIELANKLSDNSVMIGVEDNILSLDDVTVVSSNYQVSEMEKGIIAIIGPTRMEYDKVIKILDYASDKISQLFNENRGENSE